MTAATTNSDLSSPGVWIKSKSERFYPHLGKDSTIGQLRDAAKQRCYTNEEDYIFYKKSTKDVAKDTELIKNTALFEEIKDNNDDVKAEPIYKIIIKAEKTYPSEKVGETQDEANKLVDELVALDNKAYYAVGSIDGCQIVVKNILSLLEAIFADVDKDPLLQTLVTMSNYNSDNDKKVIEENQAALKKYLLDLGKYQASEIEIAVNILGTVIGGISMIEGLKWATKIVKDKFNKNKTRNEVLLAEMNNKYGGGKPKQKSSKLNTALKAIDFAASIATLGLTIGSMVMQAENEKARWRTVCQELIEQKKERYNDYEDIYSLYDDISDSMMMLRYQFVTNFEAQCTEKLIKDFKDVPTVRTMKENDTRLKSLIEQASISLTNITKYLNGLLVEYNEVDTMAFMYKDGAMEFRDMSEEEADNDLKSVTGYTYVTKKIAKKNEVTLNDKQKARFVDIYALWLLSKYFKIVDGGKFDKILPYDKELRGIIEDFPSFNKDIAGNSMFGEKDAPINEYVAKMRITYLYFDGIKGSASSTDNNNTSKQVVTFAFVQKVQDLYIKEGIIKKEIIDTE